MEYKFKLQEFEGPLDLLLHLIKQENIDIFDINIADITDQYLKILNQMEHLNLNIDSEYLVLASELIELKSRELLPHDEVEDDYEEDPKENLINRLIEYQKYKEISQELKSFESERKELFSREPSLLDEFHDENIKIDEDITLDDLLKAFMRFQEKKAYEKPLNTVVARKEYSVQKRAREITQKLKKQKCLNFEDLFDIYTKEYVVVTFLAVLNLAKDGQLTIKQDRNMDKIILSLKGAS
ncbi:MAG: segregation/condensation protein A [Bacilli bacterium]|nr:segregation/condensation protein A [Bacilli bacterium]